MNTLKERIKSYEEVSDIKLLQRVPIVIIINGRSFKKTTSLLNKPFSPEFMELMCAIIVKLFQEVDGSIFCYSFNDEIILIARNDQNIETSAWYSNRVQKIVSVAASIATLEFNKIAKNNNISLLGDGIFSAKTFVVPSATEAINLLISKQQAAFHTALNYACFYELLKKYNSETIKSALAEKTAAGKAELLFEECGISFDNYPIPFRNGIAAYRVPQVMNVDGDEKIKNKITIDIGLPIFTKNIEFLSQIFRSGHDLFRVK